MTRLAHLRTTLSEQPWELWTRQIAAVLRMDLRKNVASRDLDLLTGVCSGRNHHASRDHRSSFWLHARRHRSTRGNFSVFLSAAWNLLRLSRYFHLAVSWRNHREEPALLLSCSGEAR